jgi:hypothetical protein
MHSSNAFAPRFIEFFWKLTAGPISRKIALEADRVRINIDDSAYEEKDTWYGAPFKKDIPTITDGIVKLAPPAIEARYIRFFFDHIETMNIKWATNGHIKSFYSEEFKSDDIYMEIDDEIYCPARYIHAEFDLTKGSFSHFDGAIHFYTPAERSALASQDMNHAQKSAFQIKGRSKKMFRLDGEIPIVLWAELVCQFFTGNPLIYEYFDGKYPPHILEMLDKVRNK